ncbi:MAG: U32 family peptidase [Clostridiales bacterium]|jgi:putative protease|nr:U32 family peptidase [Clostridiales bacterium]
MTRTIELAAPAGGLPAFYAAIDNGADAVYLGGLRFSARAGAANFSDDELKTALDYAHTRERSVYLAVNTLLFHTELERALEWVYGAYENGVDALITQDAGFSALVRRAMPDLPLHASTQAGACDAEAVREFVRAGFSRVILARELTLEEIAAIDAAGTGAELEVFAHGALCVSYSGQCLMSSMIGGRSANRGACAQPCRLPYSVGRKSGYLMSPRDLCTLPFLDRLAAVGVRALKIEGRMKSPEYVATVTSVYRSYLDRLPRHEPYTVDPRDEARLAAVFGRGAFTRGYYFEKPFSALINFENPDGGQNRRAAQEMAAAAVAPSGAGAGQGADAGASAEAGAKAGAGARPEVVTGARSETDEGAGSHGGSDSRCCVPLIGRLVVCEGRLPEFTVRRAESGEPRVTVRGAAPPERALRLPLTGETARRQLNRTGGTPFRFARLDVQIGEGFALSASALNALRRDALAGFAQGLVQKKRRAAPDAGFSDLCGAMFTKARDEAPIERGPSVSAYFRRVEADFSLEGVLADRLYLPVRAFFSPGVRKEILRWRTAMERRSAAERRTGARTELFTALPWVTRAGFYEALERDMDALFSGAGGLESSAAVPDGFLAGNIGTLVYLVSALERREDLRGRGLRLCLDACANVTNGLSLRAMTDAGASCVALSPEMDVREVRRIAEGGWGAFCEAAVYGRQLLMQSEYCPVGAAFGCAEGQRRFSRGDGQVFWMKDRKAESFLLLCDHEACRCAVYNAKTLFLPRDVGMLREARLASLRLDFTDEPPEDAARVSALFYELAAQKGTAAQNAGAILEKHACASEWILARGITRGYFAPKKESDQWKITREAERPRPRQRL